MKIKSMIALSLKVIALTVLYFVLFMVSSALVSAGTAPPPEDQMGLLFLGITVISTVNVMITTLIILSSRGYGWQLAGATAFAFYGVATFLSAIEAVYYAPALGSSYQEMVSILPAILLPNLLLFTIFMPLAVLILGKWRSHEETGRRRERPVLSRQQWIIKLAAVAIIYYLIYFSFGFFIAWSNPELQAMYSAGADNTLLMVWGVIPLQLFRSLLWVLFALPLMRMMRGRPWQKGLLIGLLFSLPMSVPLILPNELMPDAGARLSHFFEITSSNFLFGMIVVWLLHRSHRSLRDLFGVAGVTEEDRFKIANAVTKEW